MPKDIKRLKQCKGQIIFNFQNNLQVSQEDAEQLYMILEKEDFFKIEAPELEERPAQLLIKKKDVISSKLGMNSHKAGNIILNIHTKWKNLVILFASVLQSEGFDFDSPVAVLAGIVASVLSASDLIQVEINEKGTAIIMSLQQHNRHRIYGLAEEQCKEEANEILTLNGYKAMTESDFQEELTRLIKYNCIEKQEEYLLLKEKVLFHY